MKICERVQDCLPFAVYQFGNEPAKKAKRHDGDRETALYVCSLVPQVVDLFFLSPYVANQAFHKCSKFSNLYDHEPNIARRMQITRSDLRKILRSCVPIPLRGRSSQLAVPPNLPLSSSR